MLRRTAEVMKILAIVSVFVFSFASCSPDMFLPEKEDGESIPSSGIAAFQNHADIISTPIDDDLAFIQYNDNQPEFAEDDWNGGRYYIYLSELDEFGRVGVTQGLFDYEHFPDEERGSISSVTPTGWVNNSYSIVSGGYLLNRCHTLGHQFSGINAEPRALIAGTRFFNIEGNLPFENIVADHMKENNGSESEVMHQVLVRVTPDFYEDNLFCHGVIYEADCMQCDDIDFAVYMMNKQPGITIDYRTGDNWANDGESPIDTSVLPGATAYVYSRDSDKFHLPSCRFAVNMKEENRVDITAPYEWMVDKLELSPCGICNPYPVQLPA